MQRESNKSHDIAKFEVSKKCMRCEINKTKWRMTIFHFATSFKPEAWHEGEERNGQKWPLERLAEFPRLHA